MGEPLKGRIKKQPSCMMVIPINVENIINPEFVYYNLRNSREFDEVNFYFDSKKRRPGIKIKYHTDIYDISFSVDKFHIPKNFNLAHYLSPENVYAIKNVGLGVTTTMLFGDDPVQSYFLQLKALNCIAPDSAGIIDFSAERIYSPVWAAMACESSAAPALSYMYSVQAVSDDKHVWLHTHGLKRCGFMELEILESTKENYMAHSAILNEMASSIISNNSMSDELEPFFVTRLPDGNAVVNTWINYKKAIKMFDKNIIGTAKDRNAFHDKSSAVVFNYPTENDYAKKAPVKLSDLGDNFFDNPLVMITNEETKRMTVLAAERYNFLKEYFNKNTEIEALVKVRLKVDDDKLKQAGSQYEHIWFNVKEIDGDKLIGVLSQEPFYIDGIHTGDEMEISKEDISDWKMFYRDKEITPDSCYMLVEGIIDL